MIKIIAAAATLTAVLAAGGSCGQGGTPGNGGPAGNGPGNNNPAPGRVNACTTTLDPPHLGSFNGKPAIIASSHSNCTKTPVTHIVDVGMDLLIGGDWTPVPTYQGVLTRTCADIPHGAALMSTICPVTVPCVISGKYRTRVSVHGNGPADLDYPSGKPFAYVPSEANDTETGKPQGDIVCPKPTGK